jgi:hypothetical protein
MIIATRAAISSSTTAYIVASQLTRARNGSSIAEEIASCAYCRSCSGTLVYSLRKQYCGDIIERRTAEGQLCHFWIGRLQQVRQAIAIDVGRLCNSGKGWNARHGALLVRRNKMGGSKTW